MASDSILPYDPTADVRKSSKRKGGWRAWSDLSEDVLRLVVKRVFLEDRIRFRVVCKKWLPCPTNDINDHKIPSSFYMLIFDPYHKLSYVIEDERDRNN